MTKPLVLYSALWYPETLEAISPGIPVVLETINHPSELVSNRQGTLVRTSLVISIDLENCTFETENSIYQSVKPKEVNYENHEV